MSDILLSSKDGLSSERAHHPYSPSTLGNLEWCPHYTGRQSETPHVRTVAGTRAHGVVETGEDDHRLSDEDAVAAAECLDFVEQRKRIMFAEAAEARQKATTASCALRDALILPSEAEFEGKIQELQETYLPVDDRVFPDCAATTAGYVDRVLINYNGTHAEMFDWKFGFWPVEKAEDNLQGIAYVLGLFHAYPSLTAITFFFKQPHLGILDKAVFTRAQVPELYLRVQTVVARAREARRLDAAAIFGDFSLAKPGVPICNFCANLGRCEKVAAFACKVGRKFHPVEVPEDITPTTVQDPHQTTLAIRLASILKVWCDAFRRQVTDRVLRGEADLPAGHRIQEMSKRELIDPEKFRGVALRYLTQAEFESTLESSFGAVEKIVSDKAPRGQKTTTLKELQQALLDCGAVKKGDSFSFLRAVSEK